MILVAIEEISCWKYIFLVLYGARIRLHRLPKATSSSDPLDNL